MLGNYVDESYQAYTQKRVKLRKTDGCAPEVQSVLECEEMGLEGVGCGRRCGIALDDKNYRSVSLQNICSIWTF